MKINDRVRVKPYSDYLEDVGVIKSVRNLDKETLFIVVIKGKNIENTFEQFFQESDIIEVIDDGC